ncbi:hypothetical protein Cgig2_025593 [Carnegiea gigantea]|uniref:Transposase-associated domain-containing protein n=1 Tax=Carnegiea gigantea TaxID=171969 RepID=A0A9Q1Q5R2_9CARY|nr:hypothetical protein Cgig2_025593 [Carnegiea gigantea]
MDSSWIELPNDHPDYLDGAVKFIKLAKENLVEGRTRCPCRRCKVDKWLPIEEVEQHILFKGFHKEYKHFIFHGKGDILDHVKYRGSTSREINIDPSNFTSGDDMEGLLKAAFGVDMPRCKDGILHDVVNEPLDEEVEPFLIYGNGEVIKGSILPRDVMNYKQGVRFCVAFNNYNQPIRKGGYIFVRFLGYIARLERFCPIETISWHKLNKTYKADIIEMVRSKFVYPTDKCFDKRVLKHVAKHFKQYKHGLKKDYFKPEQKTKEAMYELVPKGHVMGGCDWLTIGVQRNIRYMYLTIITVIFAYSFCLCKRHLQTCLYLETLAEIGRDARASQMHCHTTGSTSYAEKRANFVETHGREPTYLEFFKETHGKDGGGFVANTATESFLTEASAKVQERLLSSSPSKTQVEIENEVFDELMYEEENPKRPIDFGFNVDRSDVFGVNSILRKRGYIFSNNNMELKRVKEELASQKAMFLLMLKAVRNGKITDEFLDATEAALRMAGDQVPQESSGNNLINESGHAGPSTSASQVN